MPRWLRMIRGTIGTGLAFAVGGGAVAFLLGVPLIVTGRVQPLDLLFVAARFGAVGFLLGVVFAGVLAVTARGLTLDRLSVRRVAGIGAGLGLGYFALIAQNGIGVWSLGDAILNLVSVTAIGGGSAAAMLLLARRAAGATLGAGKERPMVSEGSFEPLSVNDERPAATPASRR